MNNSAAHKIVLDGYLSLAANLPFDSKLDLIAKLSSSVKNSVNEAQNKFSFKAAFGAFESEQTAEEIIAELRASRTFTRKIEEF